MEKEEQQGKIELYLSGKLENNALKGFEEEIQTDKNLKKRVNITKDVNERFDDALFAKNLGEMLQPMNEKYIDGNSPKSNLSKYKWIIVLIAILGSIGAWSLFNSNFSTKKQQPEQEIFAAYFEPYAPSIIDRSSATNENIKSILEKYEAENYGEIIPLIKALSKETDNNEWNIILGISYLNTNNTDAAIRIFEDLTNNETYFIREIGQWYLALTYLKSDNSVGAKPLLEQLSNQKTGKYSKLAKDVLSKL
jgi:hypothetical protein